MKVTAWGEKKLPLKAVLWEKVPGPGKGKAATSLRLGWLSDQTQKSLSRDRKSGVRHLLTRGQRFLWRPEKQEAWALGDGGTLGT